MDECINEVYIIMLMSMMLMMLYDINDADTDDDAEVPGELCPTVGWPICLLMMMKMQASYQGKFSFG